MSICPSTPRLSTPLRWPNVSPMAANRYGVARRTPEDRMPIMTVAEKSSAIIDSLERGWRNRLSRMSDLGGSLHLATASATAAPEFAADDEDDHQTVQRGDQRGRDLHRALHAVRTNQQRPEEERCGDGPQRVELPEQRRHDA